METANGLTWTNSLTRLLDVQIEPPSILTQDRWAFTSIHGNHTEIAKWVRQVENILKEFTELDINIQ